MTGFSGNQTGMFTLYYWTLREKLGRIEAMLCEEAVPVKSLNQWIDRFCARHPRFGIPNLMLYIVIGNVLVYLMDMLSTTGFFMSSVLSFSAQAIFHGQIWRLATFVIVPSFGGNMLFFALSLYFYWFIGSALEREWGSGKFTLFYLLGVVLNIIVGLFSGYASMGYVNLSLFFAFATLYPELQFLLFFLLPVKAKWLGWIDGALFLLMILGNLIGGQWAMALAAVIAILNYAIFFWEEISYLLQRGRRSTSRKTMNFKQSVNRVKQQKGYLHKCAVCGRTDTDHPDLDFRYCSKCKGYYCYCADHINNHVHITDG